MMGPSSKVSQILLVLLLLLLCLYIYMDVQLYLHIQENPIERDLPGNFSSFATSTTAFETNTRTSSPKESVDNNEALNCYINPLCHVTVKAVLLDHTNHYLFAPLAAVFDDVIGLSRSSFITPNMISFFHVGVACVAGKLVASDSLGYRRLGVVFFQIRTFLDDLDGHVARARKNIRGERSEVGTTGYYVDGICDALGCVALLIGMFVYLKNNPPRRGYTPLLPMIDDKLAKTPEPKIKPSTMAVAKKVVNFAMQLMLSSAAWNRYIAYYQDMIERSDVTPEQYARQNEVFRSSWFFCIAWIWRVVNVHSLTHCVLLSIFCDKLWDFLKFIQYIGYVFLLFAISVAEVHINAAYNYIFRPAVANSS